MNESIRKIIDNSNCYNFAQKEKNLVILTLKHDVSTCIDFPQRLLFLQNSKNLNIEE